MKHENLSVSINSKDGSKLSIRLASESDIENLRLWKNRNKNFFFYNKEITTEQQEKWFNEYLNRPDDYIFIVEIDVSKPIGCMGIRKLEKEWDAYNIILGDLSFGSKGYMSKAFRAMLAFATEKDQLPITLKVLKDNPAVSWYEKNGFEKIGIENSHYFMKYNSSK